MWSKYKIQSWWFWKKSAIKLFLWFILRAIDALRGKIMIIDDRIVKSNGGFKYFQINISKKPLDKNADYKNW
jgi:hypothetical protein